MTTPDYQQYGSAPPAADRALAPAGRPTTLTVGYFAGLATGLSTILGAVLLITGAHKVAEDTTESLLGGSSLSGSPLVQGVIDEAADKLVTRGIVGLVFGALVVVFVLAARNAARSGRIALTLALLGAVGINIIVAKDVAPGASKALDFLAIALSAVTVVAMFLPPTGRYAKARRSRTS